METKPGYKTTEFWFSVVAAIVGLLFAAGVVPTGSTFEQVLSLVATILAALGYTVSRAIAKAAR